MMKHKQSRKPMEKISKLPKNQVVRRKKDNQALNFKQTMATNLGNTRNAVENKPPCLTAAILAFFIRPQVPASRDKNASNATGVNFASVWRSTPSNVRLALAFARLKRAKNNACFSGY